jgi:hypothetical protein
VTLTAAGIGCDGGYYDADTGDFVGVSEEEVAEAEDELVVGVCSDGNYNAAHSQHDMPYRIAERGLGHTIVSATKAADAACAAEAIDVIKWQNGKADHAKYVCESPHRACTNLSHTDSVLTEACRISEMYVRVKGREGSYTKCEWSHWARKWVCKLYPKPIPGQGLEYKALSSGEVSAAANECTPANEDESSSATFSER